MKERPILFSAPMIRAILDGRKTMTRRIAKPRGRNSLFDLEPDGSPMWTDSYILDPGNAEWRMRDNPYGVAGDHLWVREAWCASDTPTGAAYRADVPSGSDQRGMGWRPSIHMPRWASRITLEVTGVRVERLLDINETDAEAEGAQPILVPPDGGSAPHVEGFRELWSSINGAASWDANPFVWVVEFRRV